MQTVRIGQPKYWISVAVFSLLIITCLNNGGMNAEGTLPSLQHQTTRPTEGGQTADTFEQTRSAVPYRATGSMMFPFWQATLCGALNLQKPWFSQSLIVPWIYFAVTSGPVMCESLKI